MTLRTLIGDTPVSRWLDLAVLHMTISHSVQLDESLEQRIREALAECHRLKGIDRQASHRKWEEFVALISQRTPRKVRQMEQERGIA